MNKEEIFKLSQQAKIKYNNCDKLPRRKSKKMCREAITKKTKKNLFPFFQKGGR